MRVSKYGSKSAADKVDLRRADDDIDYTDAPDRGDDDGFWASGRMVLPEGRPAKRAIAIRLDPDVLSYFQEEGRGYQTRINHVLRLYVQHRQRRGSSATSVVLPSQGSVKRAAVRATARAGATAAARRRSSKKR